MMMGLVDRVLVSSVEHAGPANCWDSSDDRWELIRQRLFAPRPNLFRDPPVR